MKLWDKGFETDKNVEAFTVGKDYLLDMKLVPYDCKASIAHAEALCEKNLLSESEKSSLVSALKEIIALHKEGKFRINASDEDCHTAIENYLVKKCGDAGKKIHLGRSRNDQVMAALRLYEKEELSKIIKLVSLWKETAKKKSSEWSSIEMPGYTHMQRAMPSTAGTWIGSFAESAEDNLFLLNAALKLIDKNPLGSAAGFGVPVFDINGKTTASKLGFSSWFKNPLQVQLSRGKYESVIAEALSQVMFDINKFATDVVLFSTKEFGFVNLCDKLTTGSSIMPQKKNPDVAELLRAKYHAVIGEQFKIKSMTANLMSGYNRDLQLTKEPVMNMFDAASESVDAAILLLNGITINENACKQAMSPGIYATEEAYKLVKNGVPFRDAYKIVAEKFS
ncbi:argininosuccinate lyase [Candidatus Woesearchaeota archaeon]|nr:MAG: argininosuccinate lyase [Candidatus Woesearchaeota archaeon]